MELLELYEKHERKERYTLAERHFIREKMVAAGLTMRNTKCSECYFEAVLQLLALEKKEPQNDLGVRLREPYHTKGVRVNGRFINGANLTSGVVEWMRKLGLDNLFEK